MSNYNKCYDNEKYNRLAKAIARVMSTNYDAPSQAYLDLMVKIQIKASWYCEDICEIPNDMLYTQNEFELLVYDCDYIWSLYTDFLHNFMVFSV